MRWSSRVVCWSLISPVFLLSLVVLLPRTAAAQGWTSTDVGAVGIPGSASESNGTWTVQGSGADIWGTADSFQFLHQTMTANSRVDARVLDLQNTNSFAKAGVMVRAGLGADAATAIFDVKPSSGGGFGGFEFMVRSKAGGAMIVVASGSGPSEPRRLRLSWQGNRVVASIESAGDSGVFNYVTVGIADMEMPASPEAGIVVTSHDQSQLATAHFNLLNAVTLPPPGWHSTDIGEVGQAGSAVEDNGMWTISAAGGDIWGTADSFRYLWRGAAGDAPQLIVRIDDLQNTYPFAKAGLMVRETLDADSRMVILDVTPDGNVEFMGRGATGGEVKYVGGIHVTFPVWLKLDNAGVGTTHTDYFASVSQDGVHFTGLQTVPLSFPASQVTSYYVGAAVTSHDTTKLTTAHLRGLSIGLKPIEIGTTGLIGNAATDVLGPLTIEGAGSDIWGAADSFEFVQLSSGTVRLFTRIDSLAPTSPFAKAGLVIRDGTGPGATSVILDTKPDGGVEFMARMCGGCDTTYLGGAHITFPAYFILRWDGTTATASISQTTSNENPSETTVVGTVNLSMPQAIGGLAVTSHDPAHMTTATFAFPPFNP
jgi:Cu/Zn superoxide dismutase